MDDQAIIWTAGAIFLLSGSIKGLVGVGLPTAALTMLTLFVDPRTAISLIMFPMIGSNLWQMLRAGRIGQTVRDYWIFAVVLCAGVAVATFSTAFAGERVLLGALGAVVLIFVASSWRGWVPQVPPRHDRAMQVLFGLIAGVIGGLTAGWAAPLAIYLATKRVGKDEFVRATGLLIFAGSLPLCFAYAQLGFLTGSLAGMSLLMLIPALIGFGIGELGRNRLSVEGFRTSVLLVFVLLGLNLIRRSIWYE